MKTEFLYFSIAGVFGLFAAGFLLGMAFAGNLDTGNIFVAVMLLLLVRTDVREPPAAGEYKRGWFVWRRIRPLAHSFAGTGV